MIKTYKYKLYSSKKNKYLNEQTKICGNIYNHCIAIKKKYYKMYGTSLSKFNLQKHITKLKKLEKYSFWNKVGSQSIQNITDRIENGYQAFFKNCKIKPKVRKVSPPSFKNVQRYQSFTLKQAGYKILPFNQVKIQKRVYKYHKSRKIEGVIKCVTVKKDSLGDWYIYFVCLVMNDLKTNSMTGKTAGFDFGCSIFLTLNDGTKIKSPLFFKKSQKKIAKANKSLSKKVKGSNNYKSVRLNLARIHKKIKNQRRDYHFKLANKLCQTYDVMIFETLDIASMKQKHGKKINDIGFSEFMRILEYEAELTNTKIHYINKWFASSKICNHCGYKNKNLSVWDRTWACPECHTDHERDHNAGKNIMDQGLVELKKLEELNQLKSLDVNKFSGRALSCWREGIRLDESQAAFVRA